MKIRQAVEQLFKSWSEIVVSHRWWVLAITFAVTLVVAPQIRNGWLDVSLESYLPVDDPAIENYNNFRREFQFMPANSLAIKLSDDFFTLENLARLERLHRQLEAELPYTREVISLVNVRYSRGEGDTLLINELGELWPDTQAEMPAFKQLVLSNPNYLDNLISADSHLVIIAIKSQVYSNKGSGQDTATSLDELASGFDDDSVQQSNTGKLKFLQPEEEEEFAKKVFEIIGQHSTDDFYIYPIGGATMNYTMSQDFKSSTLMAVSLGMLLIIILLAILFRRLSGVCLPLVVVAMALIVTLALSPVLGYAYNGNTQVIPTFILAVGIADAVHILTLFYRYYDRGMDKYQAITAAMQETSIAVVMTTLTTALGLMSFLSSDLMPTRTIGIFGAIGVVMALLYTITLVPTLLAVLPIKRKPNEESAQRSFILRKIDEMILACGNFGVIHAKPILVATCLIVALSLLSITQVRFEHDPVRWYDEDTDERRGLELMDEKMGGGVDAQILLKFGEDDSLYRVDVLHALEDIEALVLSHRYEQAHAGTVKSILSVVKETHQSLNKNDPAFFAVPDTRQTVAQEMLLFENTGSDDIYDFTNTQFETARIDMLVPSEGVILYRTFLRQLREKIAAILESYQIHNVEIITTGLLGIFSEATYTMLVGTVKSYGLAFTLVALAMIFLMGNIRRGLLAFSPNITPIILTLGIMGLTDITLNSFTTLIGCIVIGISVDDTIHFMHHFQRFSQTTDDVREIVKKTLDTCGRAITFTSIVLIGGFIVHVTGVMTVNKEFGILLSLAIFFALFANLILAPALMTVFWKFDSNKVMSRLKRKSVQS